MVKLQVFVCILFIHMVSSCQQEKESNGIVKVASASFQFEAPKGWENLPVESDGHHKSQHVYHLKHPEIDTIIAVMQIYSYELMEEPNYKCPSARFSNPSEGKGLGGVWRAKNNMGPLTHCMVDYDILKETGEGFSPEISAYWWSGKAEVYVRLMTVVGDNDDLLDYDKLIKDFDFVVGSLKKMK